MLATQPFGPIKQWGYLVKDLEPAMQSWIDNLGVGPFWGFRNVALTSHMHGTRSEVIMNVGLTYQAGVQIELIEQLNPDEAPSPYSDFYQTEQPQVFQQFGYHSLDIDADRKTALSMGLRELGYVESQTQSHYYYFDHPSIAGMVIELMEMDQMTIDAFTYCATEAETWDGSDPYRLIDL